MTFAEMRSETELLYESINSSAAPGFTTAEWGQILTIAQRKVVHKILEEGVTRDSFNILAIEKIIKNDSYTAFTTNNHFKNTDDTSAQALNVGAKTFDTQFYWVIDEYVTTSAKTNIPLKRVSFDFYRVNVNNPFRKPNDIDGFWILQYNNIPIFITDGTAITGYYIVGVYHPDIYPIADGTSYNGHGSCLNEGVHSKIVEEAVNLARMSVIDAQGYQLSLAEFNK